MRNEVDLVSAWGSIWTAVCKHSSGCLAPRAGTNPCQPTHSRNKIPQGRSAISNENYCSYQASVICAGSPLRDSTVQHQAGQCTGGMVEPFLWRVVAHWVESRLSLSVPGLQQSLRIPKFAFSPFFLVHEHFLTLPGWHPALASGDTEMPWFRGEWAGSPSQVKARRGIPALQNQIDAPCSRESAAQLFSSHLDRLSMFSYHSFFTTDVNFENKNKNKQANKPIKKKKKTHRNKTPEKK